MECIDIYILKKKLDGWKGNLLIQVDKLQLLKSVLQALPIYLLSILNILSNINNVIERIIMEGIKWKI